MSNTKKEFTHLSKDDLPRMVDVSEKTKTNRKAIAMARVHLGKEIAELLKNKKNTKKGPVIETAVIAGIQGAKKTSELIPMCHPLILNEVSVKIKIEGEHAVINVTAKTNDRTGVEMEALTASSISELDAIPVEIIIGLPVAATFLINGICIFSKDAIL